MQTKLLLAAVVVSGGLAAMQVPASAQGASAYPQTLSPYDFSYEQAAPGWGTSPRYYNEVPTQQPNAFRTHHRAGADHSSNARN